MCKTLYTQSLYIPRMFHILRENTRKLKHLQLCNRKDGVYKSELVLILLGHIHYLLFSDATCAAGNTENKILSLSFTFQMLS